MKIAELKRILNDAGVWAGIAILGYSSSMFLLSFKLEYYTKLSPGPGFFPRWLSALLIILSLVYIRISVRMKVLSISDLLPKGAKEKYGVYSTIMGIILFCLIVPYTGFVVATTAMLFIMLRRDYKWPIALGAGFIASIILLLAFQTLLGVRLPVNDFGW